jgi:hypothetical protein
LKVATMTLPTTTLRTARHRTPALRTTAIGMALGTALLAAAVGTAAPAAPADGAAPPVETRVLPASAAWSVPVEILESGAVVGNDADAGTLYGGGDIQLSGNTHPWVFSSRGRQDLGVAGRPSGMVVDVAESGVSVGWLTEAAGIGTRRLAARWNGAGGPSLLLPEVTRDTAAQDVNLRGDALVDVAGADPEIGNLSEVELITAAGERRTVVPGTVAYARSVNTRREVLYTSYSAGGNLGSSYWRDGVRTPLSAGSFRQPICLTELTETGFFAWRNRSYGESDRGVLRAADGTERPLPVPEGRILDLACANGRGGEDVVSEWGHVVGTTYPDIDHIPGPARAVLYRGPGQPHDLGTLGSDTGSAGVAVNERDDVLAHSFPDAQQPPVPARPFLWRAGQAIELPVPADFDRAIGIDLNNRGQVLGVALRFAPGEPSQARTVIWTVR